MFSPNWARARTSASSMGIKIRPQAQALDYEFFKTRVQPVFLAPVSMTDTDLAAALVM
jgi:hypothetical protein